MLYKRLDAGRFRIPEPALDGLQRLDPEVYLRDLFRVLPTGRASATSNALRATGASHARVSIENKLDAELGPLTIPEPPLPTAVLASLPAELRPEP